MLREIIPFVEDSLSEKMIPVAMLFSTFVLVHLQTVAVSSRVVKFPLILFKTWFLKAEAHSQK